MNCPKCGTEIKMRKTIFPDDADGLYCEKWHYWVSLEHAESYSECNKALDDFMECANQITTQIGQGYANALNWQEADDELIENMGTDMGRIFCGIGAKLESIKICPYCAKESNNIAIRRLNTAYCDDRQNWFVSCQECFDKTVEVYDEMWEEYYYMTR